MADKQIFDLTNDTTPASTDRLAKQSALDADFDAVALSNIHTAMTAASTTVASVVELATAAEVNTGTDATRAVTPNGLSGSLYGNAVIGGTSFPGSPSAGNLYFRTDLGWLCYYDGTRWLTCHEYVDDLSRSAIGSDEERGAVEMGAYAPYFTRITAKTFVATTNDGTKYWTVKVQGENLARDTETDIFSFTTASDTADTWTDHSGTASTAAPANYIFIISDVAKTSTPGDISYNLTIHWRYIVT